MKNISITIELIREVIAYKLLNLAMIVAPDKLSYLIAKGLQVSLSLYMKELNK